MKESTGKPILDALINASESFATPTPERAAQPQSRGEHTAAVASIRFMQSCLHDLTAAAARIVEDDDKPTIEHMRELDRQRARASRILESIGQPQ